MKQEKDMSVDDQIRVMDQTLKLFLAFYLELRSNRGDLVWKLAVREQLEDLAGKLVKEISVFEVKR